MNTLAIVALCIIALGVLACLIGLAFTIVFVVRDYRQFRRKQEEQEERMDGGWRL